MAVIWLALLFAIVALAYASVGFGGGSTYNALLALSGVEYRLIPIIALACNIVVVAGGTFRFWRAGLYDLRKALPLLAISVPAAFIGGLLSVGEGLFYLLLGSALLFSAAAMLFSGERTKKRSLPDAAIWILSGIVGFVAGLSGIGGGIFLAPLLHLVRWDNAKRIAAFASLYILVNSLAGLSGQIAKTGVQIVSQSAFEYWPLLLAVFAGGQLGSHLGLKLFNMRMLRSATAILVTYVALRLLWQSFIAM